MSDEYRRNGPARWWVLAIAMLLLAAVAVWLGAGVSVGQDAAVDDAAAVTHANNLSRAFRSAAKEVMPTVVKVRTTMGGDRQPSEPEADADADDAEPFGAMPFDDLFGDEGPRGFNLRPFMPPREGLGSGVIIDPEGVVLTNNHVVANASKVFILLPDGREFEATDVRTDEQTDLAIVRFQTDERLPAARLGDSDLMEIGDWVIAIGSPFELDQTVSAGIISSKGRSLMPGQRTDYLQTDAAINPGNSGGPLVNLNGEVIGINTAIATNNGRYQGVGFAIPANLAKWVYPQLLKEGKVRRAYLGVAIEKLDNELAAKLHADVREGVLINEVFPETPAAKAGLEKNDIVLRFAGHPVSTPRELQQIVEQSPLDAAQQATVFRSGRTIQIPIQLEALPEDFGMARRPARRGSGAEGALSAEKDLGLRVGELTPERAGKLNVDPKKGVAVLDVASGSVAEAAGLTTSMVVLRVGKTPVNSVKEFEAALGEQDLGAGILLLVRTKAGNRFIVLRG